MMIELSQVRKLSFPLSFLNTSVIVADSQTSDRNDRESPPGRAKYHESGCWRGMDVSRSGADGLGGTRWGKGGGAMENDEGVPEGSSRADSCLSTLRFGRVRATIKFAEAVASSFSFFFPNRKKGRNG